MTKRNFNVKAELQTPLRRSPRLLHTQQKSAEPQSRNICTPRPTNSRLHSSNSHPKPHKKCPKSKTPIQQCRSDIGLRSSQIHNSGVVVSQKLRRSPRFSNNQKAEEIVEKRIRESKVKKPVYCDSETRTAKREMSVRPSEQKEVSGCGVVMGLKAANENVQRKVGGLVKGTEAVIVTRKRKRRVEDKVSRRIQGWTKEQEVALERAYLATKPTPSFWKKISKLVPGKSAQDCFDKVHSDHVTPPQPQPRSRSNKINSSPLNHFSLSASKLLQPTEPKIKRSSCNKRKSHLAQKMVRHLLQKNSHMDPGYEADLFSVLEPDINPTTQVYEQGGLVSTQKYLRRKQGFLRKGHERSPGQIKPLTECSNSFAAPLVSPPVLKQVKNKALHEKYLDQLHCREAKRKAASVQAAGKENRVVMSSQKVNVVRAAKSALITDARNVINQFRHLNENTATTSSDFECVGIDCDDEDDELEL